MLSGLRNAPSVFQRFIQDIFSDELGIFIQIYLDDKKKNYHIKEVNHVLRKLIENYLFAKLEKCDLHVEKTHFLGSTITPKGITMNKDKSMSIMEWLIPKNIKEFQRFLGLCSFNRRFIKDFASIMEPLRHLLMKNKLFKCSKQADEAFNNLKNSFNKVLIHPDMTKNSLWKLTSAILRSDVSCPKKVMKIISSIQLHSISDQRFRLKLIIKFMIKNFLE